MERLKSKCSCNIQNISVTNTMICIFFLYLQEPRPLYIIPLFCITLLSEFAVGRNLYLANPGRPISRIFFTFSQYRSRPPFSSNTISFKCEKRIQFQNSESREPGRLPESWRVPWFLGIIKEMMIDYWTGWSRYIFLISLFVDVPFTSAVDYSWLLTFTVDSLGNSNLPLTRPNFISLQAIFYIILPLIIQTSDNSNLFLFPLKVQVIGSRLYYYYHHHHHLQFYHQHHHHH